MMNTIGTFMMGVLGGTPWWVWLIFAYLVLIGIRATSSRLIYVPRLFIIPAVLIILKLQTVIGGGMFAAAQYAFWLLVGTAIGYFFALKTEVKVFKAKQSVQLPGSYDTLFVCMGFFAVKYIFGFLQAINPQLAQEYFYIELGIGALFSGYFLGKALSYLRRFLIAPKFDMKSNKENVYQLYEKIVDWFDQHRSRELFEKPYLDLVVAKFAPGAKILDLGCGMGEPIAQYFIEKGYRVTGVDASKKMIDLARIRVPQATFLVHDMRTIALGEKFDAIFAWHSFFHLPQDDQRAMFNIFEKHIKPGGLLLFTAGPEAGEVWGDNGGQNLYHASLSPAEYQELLEKHHFELIAYNIEDKNCGDATVCVAQYAKD